MLDALVAVRCERYACTLSAGSCATRTVRLAFSRRADVPLYPACAMCPTGVRRREWLVSQGWSPGPLRNEVRPDQRAQLAARRRFYQARVASEFVPAAFGGA